MPFSTSVFVRNGRFVDLTPLKSGAFGAVYRALDTQLSRRVAVKATIPGNRPFDVLQREFSKEARLQASFSHPNIVTTHELLEDSGELYLVCEYADHGSLGDLLEKGSTLDEQQVISVGLDICAALRAITRRGIIHRDVKPSNILLYNDPTRSFPVAKLGDFGVALEQGMTRPEQLRPLPHPGSPLYMPPEQLSEDDKPLTSAVDIFALGACLWEMFTGEHYKLKKKLPGHYPNVRDLAPNASEGIAKVIEWAVQEDPTLRYQTPEDLEADLRRVRDGKRPIGPVLPAARFPRFLRSMLFGVAVFLVAGTGYIGIRAFNDQGGPSQAPTVAGIAAGIADAPSNTPASAPTVTSVASSTAEATATFTPEPPTSTPEPPTDTPTNTPTHTPPPTNTSMPPTNTPKLPTKTPEPPPTAPPITPPTDTPIPPTNTPAPEPPPTSILDVL